MHCRTRTWIAAPLHRAARRCQHVLAACLVALSTLLLPLPAAAAYTVNTTNGELSGLWWNESESGWGLNLTQQGPIVFVAWYVYESSGTPIWYVITNCAVVADGCSGDIYRVNGGTPLTILWNDAAKTFTKVGVGTLLFTDANSGAFNYLLNGVSGARKIVRLNFASGTTPPAVDYTALWWNAAESGWGVALTQQFGTIFAALYSYDAVGNPAWYVVTNCPLVASGCTGDLFRFNGGVSPTDAWSGTGIAPTKVGTMSFAFNGSAAALMSYTLNGSSSSRLITRNIFYTAPALPSAPVANIANAGNTSATIVFTPPTSAGASAITGYTATCTAAAAASAALTATATVSPIVVSGLTNGTLYSCYVTASNAAGTSAASNIVAVTPFAPVAGNAFALTSTIAVNLGTLPAEYTCDGPGATIPLAWSNVPAGTSEFAVLMTTLPGDGTTKWNWLLYNIAGSRRSLAKDSYGIGTLGVGSDGPLVAYQPPCSQGTGAKVYTYTVYALSAAPSFTVPASQVTGALLTSAIAGMTLGSASLNLSYTRTTQSGSSASCLNVRNSTLASTTGAASVSCDSTYAYIGSNGLATHKMMDGITATNLQVPLGQNFYGANAWKIPLNPAIAATTTTAVDGPIGVAINGVPIFNPCKQGGCQNGDTKVLGELDICNGHAGRADDYHYHAAPTCLMVGRAANYWDTHPLGWALDGYAIFGYNNADGSVASRDTLCGGNTSAVVNAPTGYSYHVTDVSPYVLACFRGTPSPDLAGQGGKFSPIRQPPVTPFAVTNMTLTTDAGDSYQVLQFTSARSFTTSETGTDSYVNAAGTYKIRYVSVSGAALAALLALSQNANKTACWNFQFSTAAGVSTQPTIAYCR